MTLWIGILFYCINGNCEFAQTRATFDTKAECQAEIRSALATAEERGIMARGTCADVSIHTKEV